jgi:hypothetical protein
MWIRIRIRIGSRNTAVNYILVDHSCNLPSPTPSPLTSLYEGRQEGLSCSRGARQSCNSINISQSCIF